jgi:glycosyltransferase involved in cell wall biosynthesis
VHEFSPDIVHVHNFFPLLTPAAYDAILEAGVPVVQTLHNYRTICAGALLMRAGKPCEDCVQGSPYQAVIHGCYRGSRLGSLAVARMVNYHRKKRTWSNKVDLFIALSEFARQKFIAAGFPADRIAVKSNFGGFEPAVLDQVEREGALFVGRLSAEKGVGTMLKAFRLMDKPLRIVGDGPILREIRQASPDQIDALGWLDAPSVAREMAHAEFLVFPSEWYEGFPLTIVEAFRQGLPVIASRLGVMTEMVTDTETGLLFTAGDADDLAEKVKWAFKNPEAMRRLGVNARKVYENEFTPERNYRKMMLLYQRVLDENVRNKRE